MYLFTENDQMKLSFYHIHFIIISTTNFQLNYVKSPTYFTDL